MNRIVKFAASLALIALPASAFAETLSGTLYKAQECDCCEAHAEYLRKNGFDIKIEAVNDLADCTLPEKILLAASHLEEAGQSPFSAEALIVSAWRKYPRTFGLKGFEEQYPDSNKVLAMIMGEKGLPGRGWMAKVGQKQYALTRDGKQVVRKLVAGEEVPPLTARRTGVKLTREQDLLMQQLQASAAFAKFQRGRQAEWTFSDACRFWSIGDRTGSAIDERLDENQQHQQCEPAQHRRKRAAGRAAERPAGSRSRRRLRGA